MSGIYIHIPFCKQKCSYCDFYSEVSNKDINNMVDTIVTEIELRKNYLTNRSIETIYFGGGTPSILTTESFKKIFEAINTLFVISPNAEITFEANPNDLSEEYIKSLQLLPFNRVSLGVQSFNDNDLKTINRRHNAKEALKAIQQLLQAGYKNISIDLIYGIPGQTLKAWEKQLEAALNLDIQHISAYGLSYEEGTVLWKQRENKKIIPIGEDLMNEMYLLLLKKLNENEFERYEISNFSKPTFQSKHNSAYWQQKNYLGIGPSAHSFNGSSRQWNISSINQYIDSVKHGGTFYEIEQLSNNDKYNDYVMLSLRTSEGLDMDYIDEKFGNYYMEYCLKNIQKYSESNKVEYIGDRFRLTTTGILISNIIITDLIKIKF